MKYAMWILIAAAIAALAVAMKSCSDARGRETTAEHRLDSVLADSSHVDSVMTAKAAASDSMFNAAGRIRKEAHETLLVARREARIARGLLDSNEAIAIQDSANATPEFWRSRFEQEKAASARLRVSNTTYEQAFREATQAYDSMSNVAYSRARERDAWKDRAQLLQAEAVNFKAAVHDSRCLIRWPVRVCPSPTATFVTGALAGGTLALLAHR